MNTSQVINKVIKASQLVWAVDFSALFHMVLKTFVFEDNLARLTFV